MPEENSQHSSKAGVNLTKSLIARRNLFIPVGKETPENISQALASLSILRLDRERISCITNLQSFEQTHSIYLQENQIEKIENLSCLPNLKEFVLAALPHLIELDAQSIPNRKAPVQDREEEEDGSEDSDYEDIPELSHPLTAEKDFFADLRDEFASRSTRRRGEVVNEHEDRLKELDELQKLKGIPFERSQGSPPELSISDSEPVTPTLDDTMLQTERYIASSPLLKTAPPTCPVGASASKGKLEGSSRTKLKTMKGEASGIVKTGSKGVKK